jgi:hypothetical protein
MSASSLRIFLILIFVGSIYFLMKLTEIHEGINYRPGIPAGAIACGLIACTCIFSYVYFECNYVEPKHGDKNKKAE